MSLFQQVSIYFNQVIKKSVVVTRIQISALSPIQDGHSIEPLQLCVIVLSSPD